MIVIIVGVNRPREHQLAANPTLDVALSPRGEHNKRCAREASDVFWIIVE